MFNQLLKQLFYKKVKVYFDHVIFSHDGEKYYIDSEGLSGGGIRTNISIFTDGVRHLNPSSFELSTEEKRIVIDNLKLELEAMAYNVYVY